MMYRSSVCNRFLRTRSSSINTGSKYPRGSDSYSIQRSSMMMIILPLLGTLTSSMLVSVINRWRTWRVALLWRYFSPSSFCLELFPKLVENSCCSCVSERASEWGEQRNEWSQTAASSHKCLNRQVRFLLRLPHRPLSFADSLSLLQIPSLSLHSSFPLPFSSLFSSPSPFCYATDCRSLQRVDEKVSLFSLSLSLLNNRSWSGECVKRSQKEEGKCTEEKEHRKEREGNGFANEAPEWNGCVITISWTIHTRGHCLVAFSPSLFALTFAHHHFRHHHHTFFTFL